MKTIEVPPLNSSFETAFFYNHLIKEDYPESHKWVKEVTFKKNHYLYRPPFTGDFIYEIVTGAIKLGSYLDSGEEYVYDIINAGDFFGNLKYLNGQFFEFSKTLVASRIRIYGLSFFKKQVVENPKLAEWFMSYLVKRWCITQKKLGKINERDSYEKLRYLRNYFDIPVFDNDGNQYIIFDLLTQKDLADLIGTTRQTIASLLKK